MAIKYSEKVQKAVRRIPPMYRPTVERALTETADKFDDAMREGLRIKLEKHGVHYTD